MQVCWACCNWCEEKVAKLVCYCAEPRGSRAMRNGHAIVQHGYDVEVQNKWVHGARGGLSVVGESRSLGRAGSVV